MRLGVLAVLRYLVAVVSRGGPFVSLVLFMRECNQLVIASVLRFAGFAQCRKPNAGSMYP